MRSVTGALMLLVVLCSTALAQQSERQRLRQQILTRFMQNYRSQAGLTDEQFERFRETTIESMRRRSAVQQRERTFWQALEAQMRPGVAANQDSVTALIDSLVATQRELGEIAVRDRQTYAEFLSPVQQAQLLLDLRRLQQRIEQIIRNRLGERNGARSRDIPE